MGKLAADSRRQTLIRYRVRIADPAKHHFEVTCEIPAPAPVQRVTLPSWTPGSYLLREFARHVVALEAVSGGGKVEVEKIEKGTWACSGARGQLTIRATIYALDQSVRGAFLDRRRAYFNGACLFFLVEGRETEAVELELAVPTDAAAAEWRVATACTSVAVDDRGFGTYRAADYDELIDHPVEIGDFGSTTFTAGGVPHELAIAGKVDTDLERIAADLRQICEAQIDFFGRPPPFARYVFLCVAVADGHGGLEHRASSSLIFSRDDLPKPGEPSVPRAYQRFLALASHEYFHTWHVKRTKPTAFMPYRLDRRNYTRSLWVFEGITSYYQDLFLLRSHLIGVQAYLQRLGEQLTRVYRTPGRLRQSLADSSFDAWDSLYKPDSNSPNAGVSYYTKGALVALALDLTLRAAAEPHSLDEIMLALWRRHGARDVGVAEDGFERIALEIGGPTLDAFFATAVHGTEDLPLGDLLGACGVALHLRPSAGPVDPGGTPGAKDDAPFGLGAIYRSRDGGLELLAVLDDGPAQAAGLCPGDLIIAIGGLRVGERNLAVRLAREDAGTTVRVTAFRGDELIDVDLVLTPPAVDTCFLELDTRASAAALERRRAWIGE